MADKHQLPGSFVYEGIYWCDSFGCEIFDKIKTLPMTESDIIVAGCFRSGTTWIQEIVWLIMHDGQPDDEVDVYGRVPLLEGNVDFMKPTATWKPGGNIVKTHQRYHMLQKQITEDNVKVILVMRNVKDHLVSLYHFYRMSVFCGNYKGSWDEFFELFKARELLGGDWLDVNLGWWLQRDRPNIHLVFYEDMKRDLEREIRKMAKFLNKELSDETINFMVRRTTFESMKENPALNCTLRSELPLDQSISPFIRKGEVGDWINYFTQQQLDYIEKYYDTEAKEHGLLLDDQL